MRARHHEDVEPIVRTVDEDEIEARALGEELEGDAARITDERSHARRVDEGDVPEGRS